MVGKHIMIAGTRGIPASHGGFETFAERLSLFLKSKGWKVSVLCQTDDPTERGEKEWKGVSRVIIPVRHKGPLATLIFDWKSTVRACEDADLVLVLGYNTAIFSTLYWMRSIPNIFNMDGVEWKRAKWRWWQRGWLYINERVAGLVGTRLIADHPSIKDHLARGVLGRQDISVIPYGANPIDKASTGPLSAFGLVPQRYVLIIARPEPENQVLEMVRAFSCRRRGMNLVVLGAFKAKSNVYHRTVMNAANDEVIFTDAIYDQDIVGSLRFHAALYMHGHTVGGTNPSLVEALGAGTPVLAHDNVFNRWVAGLHAAYFKNEQDCSQLLDELLDAPERLVNMRHLSREQFDAQFSWENILPKYEKVLNSVLTFPLRSETDGGT